MNLISAPRILVVEAETHTRSLISSVLEASGYEVADVAAIGAARSWLRSGQPADLIVLDLALPRAAGFDLLARIGELPSDERPPTVVLSAVGRPREHARAIDAGADRVVTKPLRATELLEVVRDLLPAPVALGD